jgi:Zn-dependent peptidase ImmA (M78 family)
MRNSRDAYVRAEADKLLKAAGIAGPPVPIDQLVASLGLSITKGEIPQGWGFFHPGTWTIRLSPSLYEETPLTRNRRRFTLAHELGHCVLEHGEQTCWNLASVAEPADLSELDDFPNFEQEAHHFARELLLPRLWLGRDWQHDPDPQKWERVYVVSRATLIIVLMERHLLMARRKRR